MNKSQFINNKEIEPLLHLEHIRNIRWSNTIYLASLILIITVLTTLPYLYVNVSVSSTGILRPVIEVSIIKIPVSGKVRSVYIAANQHVSRGQKLIALDSTSSQQKISFLSSEIEEDEIKIKDLRLLISGQYNPTSFLSPLYRQSLLNYLQKKQDLTIKYEKAKIDYNRNHKLYQQKVIADAEMENFIFSLDKAKNELAVLEQSQLSAWQIELQNLEKEIADHQAELKHFQKEKDDLIIRAPVNGIIENLESIYEESQVFANQDVARISPDTSLIIESFIKPSDIGLLKPDMNVRFQIDAFNYNQWGMVTGKVLSISNDVHIINDIPVFKVKCSIDKDYLQLKNGYKGFLKKGMTLQARFIVTERTLWQLLYDKVDDWLNPNTFAN